LSCLFFAMWNASFLYLTKTLTPSLCTTSPTHKTTSFSTCSKTAAILKTFTATKATKACRLATLSITSAATQHRYKGITYTTCTCKCTWINNWWCNSMLRWCTNGTQTTSHHSIASSLQLNKLTIVTWRKPVRLWHLLTRVQAWQQSNKTMIALSR
jgi:hypothetical protein